MKVPQNSSTFRLYVFNAIDFIKFCFWYFWPFRAIKCPSNHRIDGKTVLITGATQGIGKSTAIELAKRGGNVILACRNLFQANQLAQQIELSTGSKVSTVHLDFDSLSSVRKCVDKIMETVDRLDILINNAGMSGDPKKKVTIDGFEQVMQVNHYGPWLLTRLLLPLIKKSSPARIIFTASMSHRIIYKIDLENLNSEKSYSYRYNYKLSKMSNLLTTVYLSSMLKDCGVTVNSLCPGGVNTKIMHDYTGPAFSWIKPLLALLMRTPDQGAQTLIFLATDETIASITGGHFMNCKKIKTNTLAADFNAAEQLWLITEKQLKSHLP